MEPVIQIAAMENLPNYQRGANFDDPRDIDMIASHEDPMLPLVPFWEEYKEELADDWIDLAKGVFLALGYNEKETKEKVSNIKYNYAVQGRQECLYQLLRAWQSEPKFWLFNMRTLMNLLKQSNKEQVIRSIFANEDFTFYTKWLKLEDYVIDQKEARARRFIPTFEMDNSSNISRCSAESKDFVASIPSL